MFPITMPNRPAPSTNPATPIPTGIAPHDIESLRQTLIEMVGLGAELVRILVAQAKADPIPHPFWGNKAPVEHPTEHIARCYERITRSIRRSADLACSLGQPPRRAPDGTASPGAPTGPQANTEPPDDEAPDDEAPDQDTPLRGADRERLGYDKPDWHEPAEHLTANPGRPTQEIVQELVGEITGQHRKAAHQSGIRLVPPAPIEPPQSTPSELAAPIETTSSTGRPINGPTTTTPNHAGQTAAPPPQPTHNLPPPAD